MEIINIFPLGNMCMEYSNKYHMFLTHLVERYPFYAQVARDVSGYKILDNSLIELGDAADLSRVLKAAETIGADEIILPDVFQNGPETLCAVKNSINKLYRLYRRGAHTFPFKLMAVAQGKDVKEWKECYDELLSMPEIHVIGIPKVCTKMHPQGRPYFVNNLCNLKAKPHHLLGLWYSFAELTEYHDKDSIRSCDTLLASYMAYHGTNIRADGFTLNLETDTVSPDKYSRLPL